MNNIYKFGVDWNYKSISLFVVLILLPNLLGLLNIPTPWGFNIHTFQIAVFIAAVVYGAKGGAISGALGSIYTAMIMNNPYIIVGNIILGFFVGYFAQKKMHVLLAVWLAFLIQLPWLIASDYFFIGMPFRVIMMIVLALAVSNTVWGLVTNYVQKPVKNAIK